MTVTTTLSKDQLNDFHAVVKDGAAAILAMRFNGLGATVSYQGILQKAPAEQGLGKITLVPVNYVADEQPSDSPPISVEIDLDMVNGLTLESGETGVAVRWRTNEIDADLTVSSDPA